MFFGFSSVKLFVCVHILVRFLCTQVRPKVFLQTHPKAYPPHLQTHVGEVM